MEEITIITENKLGVLAKISELLGKSGVNIETISAHGLGSSGLVRLVTGDTATAKKVLSQNGFSYKTGEIIVVKISDSPGELGKITKKISRAGVDIESLYILSKSKGFTEVAIRPGDIAAAQKALK